jgi:phage shock protein PspC (stress-responsive transcriptional regulator)
MKKTLTVNISGIVFHIDEDAYNVLNDYLQSIKQHFSRTEGGEEIISDIEARVAEMLKERIGNERQVITLDDIEEIINAIGQPSEFGEEFESDSGASFAETNGKKTKRLYRDPDSSILGGVCGGLGAYFHTDPVWFRIVFVIASIPGLGTPLLIYLILWIIIPEAKTATEKLEMKGEKVNISNIEKSIREEIDNLKNKFNDFTSKAKRSYKKKSAEHSSDLRNIGNALARIAEVFVKMILIFVGIILLIIGLSLLLAFIAAIFGFGNQIFIVDSELIFISFPALVDLFLGHAGSNMFLTTGLLLFLGIPLVMLLYAGVKLIFGLERTRYVGLFAFNLWLVGLIITGYYGFKIAKSFSQNGIHQETVSIYTPENSPIILDVGKDNLYDRIYRYEDYVEVDEMNMLLTTQEDDFYFGLPKLEIKKSSGDFTELQFFYRAKGKSEKHAADRAQNIVYQYYIDNNIITFDPFFKLAEREVWREQQLEMVLKIPEGAHVQLSDDMYKILDNYRHSPYKLSGETWQMTDSGLEESEYEPAPFEEIEYPEEPVDLEDPESQSSKPVSMLSFMYSQFLEFLGIQV